MKLNLSASFSCEIFTCVSNPHENDAKNIVPVKNVEIGGRHFCLFLSVMLPLKILVKTKSHVASKSSEL